MSCVSKDGKIVQSVSWSVLQQRSDHRIDKRSIASLDILITLTPYKPARPLSGMELCWRDRIHFQTQPKGTVCENALFRHTFAHLELKMRLKPGFRCQTISREYAYSR